MLDFASLREVVAGLLPVVVVAVAAVVVLLADAFASREGDKGYLAGLSVAGLFVAAGVVVYQWSSVAGPAPVTLPGGTAVVDRFGLFFEGVLLLSAVLACLFSPRYLAEHGGARGEYYALLLLATAGALLMAASVELVTLFLGLETASVAAYALVGQARRSYRSAEAALKYFLLGAFASAFFLYGIALVWGLTGSTTLAGIAAALEGGAAREPVLALGLLLLLSGMAFKIALVPFHMWAPDVYEGAATPVTGFLASAVKAAGFAILLRVLLVAFLRRDLAIGGGAGWFNVLFVLAILTMTVGNVMAVVQANLKRMLAYSSIAHAGYALVGLLAAVPVGADRAGTIAATSGVLFYVAAYAAATLGAFGVVALLHRSGEERNLVSDTAGLARRHPVHALALTVFLLSLAGIPSTVGFVAKLRVFGDALAAGNRLMAASGVVVQGRTAMYWLVVVGILNSVVGISYYLRPIVAMYMRDTARETSVFSSRSVALGLGIAAFLVLGLGLFPESVLGLARTGVEALAGAAAAR